ncbi:MAG TPA: hypothetical protein VIF40_17910 [Methylosinus sp.]|jgi:hypothetical protein|uniref:hypothetical protein n=1 Tax=Methylosinus sp. TaxID=427 RepID=UPI002F940581
MSIFTIIAIDESMATQEYVLPPRPGYDALKRVLGPIFEEQRKGAHFEHVAVLGDDGRPTDMFVDDTGALLGHPINLAATRVYHRASIARGEHHERGIIPGAPMIYGLVVVFDRRVWF